MPNRTPLRPLPTRPLKPLPIQKPRTFEERRQAVGPMSNYPHLQAGGHLNPQFFNPNGQAGTHQKSGSVPGLPAFLSSAFESPQGQVGTSQKPSSVPGLPDFLASAFESPPPARNIFEDKAPEIEHGYVQSLHRPFQTQPLPAGAPPIDNSLPNTLNLLSPPQPFQGAGQFQVPDPPGDMGQLPPFLAPVLPPRPLPPYDPQNPYASQVYLETGERVNTKTGRPYRNYIDPETGKYTDPRTGKPFEDFPDYQSGAKLSEYIDPETGKAKAGHLRDIYTKRMEPKALYGNMMIEDHLRRMKEAGESLTMDTFIGPPTAYDPKLDTGFFFNPKTGEDDYGPPKDREIRAGVDQPQIVGSPEELFRQREEAIRKLRGLPPMAQLLSPALPPKTIPAPGPEKSSNWLLERFREHQKSQMSGNEPITPDMPPVQAPNGGPTPPWQGPQVFNQANPLSNNQLQASVQNGGDIAPNMNSDQQEQQNRFRTMYQQGLDRAMGQNGATAMQKRGQDARAFAANPTMPQSMDGAASLQGRLTAGGRPYPTSNPPVENSLVKKALDEYGVPPVRRTPDGGYDFGTPAQKNQRALQANQGPGEFSGTMPLPMGSTVKMESSGMTGRGHYDTSRAVDLGVDGEDHSNMYSRQNANTRRMKNLLSSRFRPGRGGRPLPVQRSQPVAPPPRQPDPAQVARREQQRNQQLRMQILEQLAPMLRSDYVRPGDLLKALQDIEKQIRQGS